LGEAEERAGKRKKEKEREGRRRKERKGEEKRGWGLRTED
jgi:hypothetical protein